MRRIIAALMLLFIAATVPVGATAAYLTQTTKTPVGTLTLPSFGADFASTDPLNITLAVGGGWQVIDVPVDNPNGAPTTWGLRIRLEGTPEENAVIRSDVMLDSIITDCSVRSWPDFETRITVAGKVGPGYRYPSEPSVLYPAAASTPSFYMLNTAATAPAETVTVPFSLEIISAEQGGWQRGALWDSPRENHCQSTYDTTAGSSIPGRIAVRSIPGTFIIPSA